MSADKGGLIWDTDRLLVMYNGFVQAQVQAVLESSCNIDVITFTLISCT